MRFGLSINVQPSGTKGVFCAARSTTTDSTSDQTTVFHHERSIGEVNSRPMIRFVRYSHLFYYPTSRSAVSDILTFSCPVTRFCSNTTPCSSQCGTIRTPLSIRCLIHAPGGSSFPPSPHLYNKLYILYNAPSVRLLFHTLKFHQFVDPEDAHLHPVHKRQRTC